MRNFRGFQSLLSSSDKMFSIRNTSALRQSLLSRSTLISVRSASTSLSPASIQGIESRWTKLPEAEQGAIADYLAEAEKGDWKNMTLEQKRAAYFIAYGKYGARRAGDPAFKWRVLGWSSFFFGVAYVLWKLTAYTRPKLVTHTPEWKEAERQKAIASKANPYTGEYSKVLKAQAEENK
ncbi:Cytochrome c oxidase subunit 5A [Nowakowskiella sp. JEL0407]|nr:Cytochrome c oxidase subunit 5A [Nowakowskiella sp. JEL0407]